MQDIIVFALIAILAFVGYKISKSLLKIGLFALCAYIAYTVVMSSGLLQ